MISNLTIILMSGFILSGTFLFCQRRWSQLDIVDLYILFAGIYFGAYSFVKAWLEDYSRYDPITVILVFSQIIVILTITWILWRFMPPHFRQALEIKSLFEQWKKINPYIILLLLAILVIFQLVGYGKYNVISHIDQGGLIRSGNPLPYWFSSTLALLNDLIFCTFIALTVKIITAQGSVKKLWIIPLVILLLIASIYGRRSVLNLLIVGTILVFVSQGMELFRLKYVKMALLLSLALLLFSNLFQAYRGMLQFPPSMSVSELRNPLSAALDVQATIKNLKMRPTAWEFNYSIFSGQRNEQVPLQLGGIFWQGVKNSIPKIFWPGKEIVSLNDLTANLYGLQVMDYGKNNYAFAQVDFGYFSLIAMPALMIMIFLIMVFLTRISYNYPTIYLFLTGFVLNYLINIEENFADVLILFRNMTVVSIIIGMGYALNKIIQKIRKPGFSQA